MSYEAQVQVVGLEGVGFNLRVGRPRQLLAALAASVRNPENIRRVELAWGARRSRVGALRRARRLRVRRQGGAPRSASRGLSGFSPRRSSRRSRPRSATVSGESASSSRWRCSARVALAGSAARPSRRRAPSCSRSRPSSVSRDAHQARPSSAAAVARANPEELIASNGATSTIESLGTLVGPLPRACSSPSRTSGVVFAVGAAALLLGGALGSRVRSRAASTERAPARGRGKAIVAGFRRPRGTPGASSGRRADRRADVRPRLPERPDRRRRLPGLRRQAAMVGYLTAASVSAAWSERSER